MLSKRNISMWAILFCLSFCLLTLTHLNAADTTIPIITHIDEILKDNPIEAGKNVRMITIAQDDAITLNLVRTTQGFVLKPHIHKTHDESVYVIKGTGQMLINDKWVDIKPGSVHFNPIRKVHSIKHTGNEELVIISIFTPALKEPDRHFVD
jgi:mannose-6-phosphate isomerase-like protein (cupin superfamily)